MNPSELSQANFWRELAPEMSIDGVARNSVTVPVQSLDRLRQRMAKDGYFQDSDEELGALAPKIADTIKRCVDRGLPAVFVWLYDEPWQCFGRLRPVIGNFLGPDYKMLPDFWAWHVDPKRAEAGWAPHVDRTRQSPLAADGTPLSLTCWIPLSEANPLNSCIYVVPAYLDPFYNRPSARSAPPRPETIRALPAKAGDYLIWNQAVLHWGSGSSEFADAARMSMAIEFQRGDIDPFNVPLLDAIPDFTGRLNLLGKQILQYRHMYSFTEELVAVANHFRSPNAGVGD
jgi:hypothetical protein